MFNNIPNGVNVYVSNRNIVNDTPSITSRAMQACLVTSEASDRPFPGGVAAVVAG